MERYLRVNLLGPGPRLMEKRIYRPAVSQRLMKHRCKRFNVLRFELSHTKLRILSFTLESIGNLTAGPNVLSKHRLK